VTFEPFDVVVVPFPFTDRAAAKRRPALVLSKRAFGASAGASVMAMVTSARNSSWPLDVVIRDLGRAGLSAESVVRMKLFTLDHRLVLRGAGHLSPRDVRAVKEALGKLLPR